VRAGQLCRDDDSFVQHRPVGKRNVVAHRAIEQDIPGGNTPIWRRIQAGSATFRSMPSTRTQSCWTSFASVLWPEPDGHEEKPVGLMRQLARICKRC